MSRVGVLFHQYGCDLWDDWNFSIMVNFIYEESAKGSILNFGIDFLCILSMTHLNKSDNSSQIICFWCSLSIYFFSIWLVSVFTMVKLTTPVSYSMLDNLSEPSRLSLVLSQNFIKEIK